MVVVLGDVSNGPRVHVDGNRSSITSHDIYKAASEIMDSSNSYDLSELQYKTEGGQEIVVASAGEAGRTERSTKRKELLSRTIDE